MVKYLGTPNPDWIAWKIEAKDALKYATIIVRSSVKASELLDEPTEFLEAWLPNLEDTLAGRDNDSDVSGIYIIKDGGVFIGFEIPSQFGLNYWLCSPVKPQQNLLELTVEVYCQRNKLTDKYIIQFNDQQTKLIELSFSSGGWLTKMQELPLEVDRNLKLVEDWPPKP